jgi:hypothetical protein
MTTAISLVAFMNFLITCVCFLIQFNIIYQYFVFSPVRSKLLCSALIAYNHVLSVVVRHRLSSVSRACFVTAGAIDLKL